mgnify:CR=1 FL=1
MEAWVAWLMGLFRSEHIEFALFAAAFISATVLPGGSEAVLAGAVAGTPSRVVEFVLIAMLGNALGDLFRSGKKKGRHWHGFISTATGHC